MTQHVPCKSLTTQCPLHQPSLHLTDRGSREVMPGHFPTPYLGELFYSLCARYADRVDYPNVKSVLHELFGTSTVTAVVDLPSHLDKLVEGFPNDAPLNVDKIIDEHTPLAFFSAILPPDRVRQLRKDMSGSGGQAVHTRSGIMASRIPLPSHLRYCPLCTEKDQRQFRETYWRQLHQLAGVLICPVHEVFLEDSNVSRCAGRNSLRFVTADAATPALPARHIDSSSHDHSVLLRIARDAAWLLEHPIPGTYLKEIHNRYLNLLLEHGLATHTGGIHARALKSEFESYYSLTLLRTLGCAFTGSDQAKTNWLLRLVRPPRNSQHPIYHLLLIQFLGHTVEEFFLPHHAPNTFGEGPWPCLNPAAEHYREQIIQEYTLSSRTRGNRVVATFSCDCGFSYARSGPDSSAEDRYRIGRIISFGPVWEAELKHLWEDSSNSLSEIGRRLRVDPLTVRRHATKLKLPFNGFSRTSKPLHQTAELRAVNNSAEWQKKRHACRSEWLSATRRTPKASFKDLRCILPRQYAWLRQNDSEWLKNLTPKPQRHVKVTSSVDWQARDAQYAVAVKSSALRLRNAPGRPIRITRTAIGRDLGTVTLLRQKHHKMPMTTQVLDRVVETREEYASRRVWWAAGLYLNEKVVPQEWQLISRANVHKDRENKRVIDAIQSAMRMLNFEPSPVRAATA